MDNPYKKYIEPICCALLVSVVIMILPGCETVPLIVTVDKRQDYTMPSEFWIHGLGGLTMDEIAEKCPNINGCIIPQGEGEWIMYYRTHNVAEHEFDHIVFGPKHNKVKR